MVLSTYLQNRDAFFLVSSLIVFIFVYLGIRIFKELGFIYYHATFIEIGFDQDENTKVFNELRRGFIIRRSKQDGKWEMADLNGGWAPLPPNQIKEVESKISSEKSVYLYFH